MIRGFAASLVVATVVLTGCAVPTRPAPAASERTTWRSDKPLKAAGAFPSLRCTPTTVAFGGSVSCALANGGPLNTPVWRFHAENGLTVTGPTGVGQWAGTMVVGGDVVVDYFDPNSMVAGQLVQRISVERRSRSWATSVGGEVRTPR